VLSVAWWKLSGIGLVTSVSLTLPAFFLLYMFAGLALAPHIGRLVRTNPGHSLVAATLVAGSALFMFLGFLDMVDPPYSDLKLEMASTIFRPASMSYAYAAMGLGFLLVFSQRGGLIAAGLGELGRHSYGIFLIHLLLLQIAVNRLLDPPTTEHLSDMWGLLRIVATWGLCLALSYATVRALSRFTVTQRFVGSNR
jgi:surface polysaccharide O-acyltransferase-like enzyme